MNDQVSRSNAGVFDHWLPVIIMHHTACIIWRRRRWRWLKIDAPIHPPFDLSFSQLVSVWFGLVRWWYNLDAHRAKHFHFSCLNDSNNTNICIIKIFWVRSAHRGNGRINKDTTHFIDKINFEQEQRCWYEMCQMHRGSKKKNFWPQFKS